MRSVWTEWVHLAGYNVPACLFSHIAEPCNLWKCTVTLGVKDLCVLQSSLHQTACIYLEKVHESCHSGVEMNMCILVDGWDICKKLPMEFVLRTLAGELTTAFYYISNWCWCTIPSWSGLVHWTGVLHWAHLCAPQMELWCNVWTLSLFHLNTSNRNEAVVWLPYPLSFLTAWCHL